MSTTFDLNISKQKTFMEPFQSDLSQVPSKQYDTRNSENNVRKSEGFPLSF